MSLFVKLLVLLLVAALAGPFFIKGPNGAPLWTLRDVANGVEREWRDLTGSAKQPVVRTKSGAPSGNVLVYRWQDASGQWHFAGEPPTDVNYDTMMIDPDTNAIAMTTVAFDRADDEAADGETGAPVGRPDAHIGPLPDPEVARQLIDDAKALQELVDQRARALDNAN